MSKGKAFVTGLVVGSVAVGVAAYLRTPQGKEAAQNLLANNEKLNDLFQTLKEEGSNLKDELKRVSQEGITTLQELRKDIDKATSSIVIKETDESFEQQIQNIHASMDDLENNKVVL